MTLTAKEKLALITRYYDGCNAGDTGEMVATLTEDVTHYFLAPNLAPAPVSGAEHLTRYWRKVQAKFEARWVVDHIVAKGDEAVIEWTLFWTPSPGSERIATRGAEWFCFRGYLIREIRSYYHQTDTTSELEGYPYEERDYSIAGSERSSIHPAEAKG